MMSNTLLPLFRGIRSCKSSRQSFHIGLAALQECVNANPNELRKKNESVNTFFNGDRNSPSEDYEYNTPEKSLVFDKNSDKFGTLSSDRKMRSAVEECEEDEDDVSITNYLDGIEGKTRYKPVNYAMMIKQKLNQNKLAEALYILEHTMLKEHKAKPDKYIYNLLISGCSRLGYTKKAFQLFNQMKKRAILPRLSTYTSLFNACANGPWEKDALDRARHLRELMIEKGVEPNVVNYNAMIKAFGRHGDLETSFYLMDEMLSKRMAIDVVTFNFLMQAAISDKEAGFRHTLLVWRKMMEKKILPNTFTFNLLLRSARDCGIGNIQSAQEVVKLLAPPQQKYLTEINDSTAKDMQVLKSPNLLLPSPQCGSLESISSSLHQPWHRLVLLGSLEGLLATMDKCKAQPNIKTFSILLETLPPSDELEETLLNEMKERKIKMDVDFLNMMIKKRNSSGRFKSALDVLNIIREEQLVPNIMTFGVLAMGCNTIKSAKELIKNIADAGALVNIQILTVLLCRAKVGLDIDLVLFTINVLLSEEITPDPKFFTNLKYFRDAVLLNMELKENGKEYVKTINNINYEKKFSKFLTQMEKIEKIIRDPSDVHPWAQFKLAVKN